MLAEAEGNPALVRRGAKALAVKPWETEPFTAMALLSDPALDVRQYLEDLTSIAINSAQQAEDLAVQAQVASRKARRGTVVLVGFGLVGLLVGIAGFAVGRSSNVRLAEVRAEMGTLHVMQRQTQDQLADLMTQAAEQREATEQREVAEQRDAAEVPQPAPVAPAVAMASVPPPASASPPATRQTAPTSFYYQPWPDSRPAARHAPAVRNQASQPVVVPRFLADIQRSVRGIFR
jgi:hypothetical protein